jgi:hypothetical protein
VTANADFGDYARPSARPPAPEIPRAEQLAHERQQLFHGHRSGQVPHSEPGNSSRQFQPLPGEGTGPVQAADVCVLDDRGGHRRIGQRCPHGLRDGDFKTVTEIIL